MKKETFNKLDLRKQLTDELKSKWYYQERKWGLKINEHSVIFDSWNFDIEYVDNIFYGDKDFPNEVSEGYIIVKEDGITKYRLADCDAYYDDEDKYERDPKNILKDILVYIANYI